VKRSWHQRHQNQAYPHLHNGGCFPSSLSSAGLSDAFCMLRLQFAEQTRLNASPRATTFACSCARRRSCTAQRAGRFHAPRRGVTFPSGRMCLDKGLRKRCASTRRCAAQKGCPSESDALNAVFPLRTIRRNIPTIGRFEGHLSTKYDSLLQMYNPRKPSEIRVFETLQFLNGYWPYSIIHANQESTVMSQQLICVHVLLPVLVGFCCGYVHQRT
jgi:hypothetical protein